MLKRFPDNPYSREGRDFLIAYLTVAMNGGADCFDGGWSREDVVNDTLMDHFAGRLVLGNERPLLQLLAFACVDRAKAHHRRDWRIVARVDQPGWYDPRQEAGSELRFSDREFIQKLADALDPVPGAALKAWLACVDERDINVRIGQELGVSIRRVRRIREEIAAVAAGLKGAR